VADHSGGTYYGLQFAELLTATSGEIQFAMNRSEPGSPDAIILSRCDIFDSQGLALKLIRSGSYKNHDPSKPLRFGKKSQPSD